MQLAIKALRRGALDLELELELELEHGHGLGLAHGLASPDTM